MKAMGRPVCRLGVLLTVSAMSVALAASGLPSGWTDDFAAAKARAAAEGKKILLVFSGSDWCGWCVKFDKETLSKSEFVKAAAKDFELVMVDSPKDKSKLSAAAGCDAFAVFRKYGKRVRKEDVAQKLRGFADEPFEKEGEVRSVSAEVKGKSGDAESR